MAMKTPLSLLGVLSRENSFTLCFAKNRSKSTYMLLLENSCSDDGRASMVTITLTGVSFAVNHAKFLPPPSAFSQIGFLGSVVATTKQ